MECLKNLLQPLRKVELNSAFRKAVSTTGLATFLAVVRYVTLGNDSPNLSRNGVGRQVVNSPYNFNEMSVKRVLARNIIIVISLRGVVLI